MGKGREGWGRGNLHLQPPAAWPVPPRSQACHPPPLRQERRAVSAMSETERSINAKLLREMEAAAGACGGGIPAVRSPVR